VDDLTEAVKKETGKVNPMAVGTTLSILGRKNIIERFDIPGKRIRGTRLLQPEKTATQLELDWDALAEKRRRDMRKLEAIVQYAYATECRQKWILDYFGEADAAPCDCCDICDAPENTNRRAPDVRELELVRKALSGVARMSERVSADEWLAKYGRSRIIECLVGADTESVRSARLNTLTTYGLLRAEGRNYVISLFREMEKVGLVKGVEKQLDDGTTLPLLGLTLRGSQVMRGTATFKMEWPAAANAISVPRSRSRSHSHSRKNERESYPSDYDFRINAGEDGIDESDVDEDTNENAGASWNAGGSGSIGEEIRVRRSSGVLPGKPKSHYRETLSLANAGSAGGDNSAGKEKASRRKRSTVGAAKAYDAPRSATASGASGATGIPGVSGATDGNAAAAAAGVSESNVIEKLLLSKLRAKRAVIAKFRGNLPQFMVFHNTGIESLAKYRPKTFEEAIGLPGVSEKKREVLEELLEIVRRYS
jgi:superfamily II DNA helicase RecQ